MSSNTDYIDIYYIIYTCSVYVSVCAYNIIILQPMCTHVCAMKQA